MIEKPEVLNNQAIILASDGSFTEAIACFKRAITIEKNNYLLWYNLGITYRDAGELKKAKHALETAFSIQPKNEDVIETLATICLSLKELDKVADLCDQGISINSENPHFYNLMGVTLFQLESYKKAAELFEEAVFINPFYADGLYNLRDTYSVLKNKSGEQECERRLKEIEKR